MRACKIVHAQVVSDNICIFISLQNCLALRRHFVRACMYIGEYLLYTSHDFITLWLRLVARACQRPRALNRVFPQGLADRQTRFPLQSNLTDEQKRGPFLRQTGAEQHFILRRQTEDLKLGQKSIFRIVHLYRDASSLIFSVCSSLQDEKNQLMTTNVWLWEVKTLLLVTVHAFFRKQTRFVHEGARL